MNLSTFKGVARNYTLMSSIMDNKEFCMGELKQRTIFCLPAS